MTKYKRGDIVTIEGEVVGIVTDTRLCLKLPGKDRPLVTVDDAVCTLLRRRSFKIGDKVILDNGIGIKVTICGVYGNWLWAVSDEGVLSTVYNDTVERC